MSNVSLYTEMKLALENEVNIKLLSSIPDVAIVALGSNATHLLECLFGVYDELGLPIENIRRIVIFDRDVFKAKRRYADSEVSTLFGYHGVNVKFVSSIENNYPPSLLTVVMSSELGKASVDGVYAYGIALTVAHEFDMSSTRASMAGLKFLIESEPARMTPLCKTRIDHYTGWNEDAFALEKLLYALQELKNSCEDCNQCSSYGSARVCPYFQLKIAELYENGQGVCENLPLAVEWKKKAIRQGFPEAKISLAKTLLKGESPDKSFDEILSLLDQQAKNGDRDAVDSIIGFLKRCGKEALAIPWYARLANAGDFEAQNRIIALSTSGEDGIPVSKEEENRWIEVALASGNRTFVSDIAQSYIDKEDWASAFKWYNRLRGEEDFDEDKLVKIFDNYCESKDLTAEQYVDRGNHYYYGIDVDEIPRLAYFCFEKAHNLGDPEGTEGIGRCLFYGRGIEKDKARAVEEYFIPAAEEGEIKSMYRLFEYYSEEAKDEDAADYWKRTAVIAIDDAVSEDNPVAMRLKSLGLRNGDLYQKDEVQAFELMQQAADRGDDLAYYFLGDYYCHGTGVPIDKGCAFRIFREMSDRGLALAERCMGCCYRMGFHVPKNLPESFGWYMKAAKRRHSEACFYIGYYYERGITVSRSLKTANEWYLIAAEEGDRTAQRKLGENYFYGSGIEKSLSEAKKWSVKAAEQGDTDAYFRAAYLCTKKIDGKVDYDKALKWYTYLAEKGNVAAKNNLGVMYIAGNGVEKDPIKGSALYLEAAQGGDLVAMSNIAGNYMIGLGVDADYEQAVYWYEKGLEGGSARCGLGLADEYVSGDRLSRDIRKAIDIYYRVLEFPHTTDDSKQYYISALIKLGNLYYYGKEGDLEEDNEKAFHLYKKAAEEGNVTAYIRLGDMYQYGYHVAKDISMAVYWFRLAAEKDNQYAREQLEKLETGHSGNAPIDVGDDLPF